MHPRIKPLRAKNAKPLQTQALTEPDENHGAQKSHPHPDLQAVIEVWPDLPGHIKAAIKALIQTHITE